MKELIKILTDEVDEEVLHRMPEWFRILKRAHGERLLEEEGNNS